MNSKVVKTLKDLVSLPFIEVAFLMDPAGHLLLSIGNSPAFNHSGEIRPAPPYPEEPSSSLYLTSLTKRIYLGIVFSAESSIDDVRAEVEKRNDILSAHVDK